MSSRAEKEELLKKLRQKELLQKEAILETFMPIPHQKAFLEAKERIRAMFCGNGAGKTTIQTIDLIYTHTNTHPYRDTGKVNHSWFLVSGLDKVEDYWRELKRWCPPTKLPRPDKMGSSSIRRLYWSNGSMTTFYSHDQDAMKLEGTNIDALYVDEPCPKSLWVAAFRGLRNNPDYFITIAATPVSEPWMYEEIYLPGVSGTNKEIKVIEAAMLDNPYLSENFIQLFESQLTDDEKEVRIKGKFAALQGRVFKEFDRRKNVIAHQPWPADWPVYVGLDVHTRKPNTAVFLGVTKDEEFVVIDECAVEGIEEFSKAVASKLQGKRIINICADNSALSADWSQRTALQMLAQGGVTATAVRQADKDVANGITKIRRLLKGTDKPLLYVMENCRGVIREFELYVWDEHRNPDKSGVKEKPRKTNDDFLDPLRYIINRKPRFNVYMAPKSYVNGLGSENPSFDEVD